jgi:hypothetical protein
LPIDTLDQVRQVIQNYCVRWMIEIFHLDHSSSVGLYVERLAA